MSRYVLIFPRAREARKLSDMDWRICGRYLDGYADAYCDETDAIFDELALQKKPETPLQIGIMLRGLAFHLDMIVNGSEETEDAEKRAARGEKAESILRAVRAAFPGSGGAPALPLAA